MGKQPDRALRRGLRSLHPGDITSALDELGIEYKINGNEANARCPYHYERRASWGINLDSGLHHCFSCGAKGTFQDLLLQVHKDWTREQATSWVLSQAPSKRRDPESFRKPKTDDTVLEMNEAKLALFTRPPRWALRSRGINAGAAEDLGILWNPKDELWICPIRDPKTHQLWGWQEKAESGRYFRNYPDDVRKSRTLFGLRYFQGDVARLVESPLDAGRLLTVGLRGAVSSYGAAVSASQLILLAGAARHLRLCLDDDDKGRARTEHIVKTFRALPVTCFNYAYTTGKDPGEMTQKEIILADEFAIPSWRYK